MYDFKVVIYNTYVDSISTLILAFYSDCCCFTVATGAAKPKDVFRIALREISAGALMGAALGLAMVAIVMLVWDEMSPTIALIVALSLPAGAHICSHLMF